MKKLLTSNISTSVAMPIKSGSLDHLQNAVAENDYDLVQAILRESGGVLVNPVVLYGCENSGSGSNYVISAGAIFFGNAIYRVAAATFTLGGGQVAIVDTKNTYVTAADADPVTFTDGNTYNVHKIEAAQVKAGTSGSGAFGDFVDLVRLVEAATAVGANGAGTACDLTANFDYGGTTTRLYYRKNRDGLVTLSGLVYVNNGAGISVPSLIATLPTNYRPKNQAEVAVSWAGGSFPGGKLAVITVLTNGELYIGGLTSGTTLSDNDQIYVNISYYNRA